MPPIRYVGWLAVLLLLVAIFRMVPMSPDRSVKASTPPAVVTIDPEATAAAEIENKLPVYEWVERMPSFEERIEVLEARSSDHKSMIDSLLTTQTKTVETIAKIVDGQEKLHRLVLGELKQSAAEPKPAESPAPPPTEPPPPKSAQSSKPAVTAPQALPRKLFAFGAEWCQPCKAWKAGPEPARIAADGCEIVPVDVDNIPAGQPRPPQVPYYELHIGGMFARHNGPLTYQQFKDMERAVLESLKGAK